MKAPKYRVIILTAGHGGMIDGQYQTAGKRSPKWADGTQYFEGVGNRQIREELTKILRKDGIKVLFGNEREKDTGLNHRVNLINSYCKKYGAKNCLGIEIHSNGHTNPLAHGYEVFTSKGQNDSDIVAEAYCEEMEKEFTDFKGRYDHSDGDKDKESYLFMTAKTACNYVLVENFFHTNERECKEILMTRTGQKRIAKVLYNTIKRFV